MKSFRLERESRPGCSSGFRGCGCLFLIVAFCFCSILGHRTDLGELDFNAANVDVTQAINDLNQPPPKRKPKAESRKPKAESRKPKAESRKPKAESRKPKAAKKRRSKTSMTGDVARLTVKGNRMVPVAKNKAAWDRLLDLSVAKDYVGIQQMLRTGSAWNVPSGTRCLVIDRNFFWSEIRFIGGRYNAKTGIVTSEFLDR